MRILLVLVKLVSKSVNKDESEIRIMFRAKDLTSKDVEKKKLISSAFSNLGSCETILVTERVVVKIEDTIEEVSEVKALEADVDFEIDSSLLPATILTQSQEYMDLLFGFFESPLSDNYVYDDLWSLICRLPSSPLNLFAWLDIASGNITAEDTSATNLLLSLSSKKLIEKSQSFEILSKNISFPRFLYNLQIIEFLIKPADS